MQTNMATHNTNQEQRNPMNVNPNHGESRKENQMSTLIRTTSVAILVTLGLALAVQAAEPPKSAAEALPYDHADFVPTSERPINFRAGGNGYYPGATPPTEWTEGTPVLVDMKGTFGNPPKEGVAKVWDFADTKSQNILWKVPVPGWGYAHPIVVRDRVIALGHPHFVTCYDLKTGKELWQREALPLLCEGQPEDKARAVQVAIDLAMAIRMWGANEGQPFALITLDGVKSAEGFQDRAAKVSRMLAKYRPAVEKIGDPDLLMALDADLALTTSWEKTTDAVQTISDLAKKFGTGQGGGPKSKLSEVVIKKYGVHPTSTWSGHVGFSDSAPASDGERVYAVFGQGQVVCYDLEGNLVWAYRCNMTAAGPNGYGAGFSRIPLLVGDKLVVKDGVNPLKLLCFDAKTGKMLWTYPWKYNNFMALRHLRLTAPAGAPVDVIITPEHHKIVRLSDGKELGEFRAEQNWAPHYHILAWDDTDTIVVGGKSTAGPSEPSACYRIKMTGPDSATGELVYELEKDCMIHMNLPTATDTHIFAQRGGIYDRKTGARVGGIPGNLGSSTVIAGKYLITQGETTGPTGRNREDKAKCTWRLFDISDPAKPRQVNTRHNLLGYADPPADYVVKNYLAEFDPFLFAGCYRGTPSYFGTDLGGVVPHGNKVLIQSTAFLYCIGPALEGVPGDNPATVQAIRAAKPAELATYLASPSALYRHTAVTAMITAGIGGTKEALTRLVKEDPYEQIRAAAILALNAAEPDAAPGTQALLPLMTAAWIGGGHDGRPERRALQLTLETLGAKQGVPLLVAAFTKTQDEPTRRSIIDFAAVVGWAAPELTQQAKAYLASNRLLGVRYLLGPLKTDPTVREAVKRAYPQLGFDINLMLVDPLGQALEGEEKIAFLVHGIRINLRGDKRPDDRAPYLRQLQAMGRGAASAIPELEKMIATRADLAGEFAPVIEAIKGK